MINPLELGENSTLNDEVWEAAGLRCNGTFPLELFSYNNSVLLDVIFRHVKETSFNGITVSAAKIWAKKGGGGRESEMEGKEEGGNRDSDGGRNAQIWEELYVASVSGGTVCELHA